MKPANLRTLARCLSVLALACVGLQAASAHAQEVADGPVQVYILSGQSNMVGIGQVDGGGSRWGSEFTEPVLSVYPGAYDADANYDAMEPSATLALESFGGTSPTPYPGGGTQVVRGFIEMPTTGFYEFRPGFGGSTVNIMLVNGQEVHRKEPGGQSRFTSIRLEEGQRVPFKITYLTNDDVGLGWYARQDIPGTLNTLVRQQGQFPYLVDDEGNWVQREDVWYRGVVTATGNRPLGPGCGAGNNNIGPELGFGWVMGEYNDQPVLILKASQGNRSLGWDFLPPGSERFEYDGMIYAGYRDRNLSWPVGTEPEEPAHGWYAGKQYDDCFQAAHEVLENFDAQFPQWRGRGYEIAGFVWWQGHKDSGSAAHRMRYEQNLTQLINTLRDEFDAPDAPFVVGTIGFGGQDMAEQFLPIAQAQLNISDPQRHPEFAGNVISVDTRPFWQPVEASPRSQDFHYNQNAGVYMHVGEALGRSMIQLQDETQ